MTIYEKIARMQMEQEQQEQQERRDYETELWVDDHPQLAQHFEMIEEYESYQVADWRTYVR